MAHKGEKQGVQNLCKCVIICNPQKANAENSTKHYSFSSIIHIFRIRTWLIEMFLRREVSVYVSLVLVNVHG